MARVRNRLTAATRRKLEQIVRLSAVDKAPQEVAALLGMASETVHDLMATKAYKDLEREYSAKVYENFDKMVEQRNAGFLLEEAAPDAAEVLIAFHTGIRLETRHPAPTGIGAGCLRVESAGSQAPRHASTFERTGTMPGGLQERQLLMGITRFR